jgi:hypothetical protein
MSHLAVKSQTHVLTDSKIMHVGVVGKVFHVNPDAMVSWHGSVAAIGRRPANSINIQIGKLTTYR